MLAILGGLVAAVIAAELASAAGAGDDGVGAVAISIGSAAVVAIGAALLGARPRHERRLAVGRKAPLPVALLVGLGMGIGALIASGAAFSIGIAIDPSIEAPLRDLTESLEDVGDSGSWPLVVLVLGLVVLAPAGEELVFRGLLLRALVRRMSFPLAAVISAIVFALVHLDQYSGGFLWPRTLALMVIGVLLALAYRSHGYAAAVTAHAVVNGVAAIQLIAAA